MSFSPHSSQVLVIANGEPPSQTLFQELNKNAITLVAVDGGLSSYARLKVAPHLIIGDFDSTTPQELEAFPDAYQIPTPDQSKSDLEKALEFLFTFPVTKITVLGAIGARVDHTLANLSLLCRYPEKVFFETEQEYCYALPINSKIECQEGQTLSLIPFGEAKKVFTQGLQWELSGQTLDSHFVGISNRCLASCISVQFEAGHLIVFIQKKISTM